MERIRELGLDELIAERRDAGVPILGICLGLQLLFDSTTELGGADGPRPARGRGRPSSTPTASRSRTSAGRRCAGSASRALTEGIDVRDARSTSSTPSRRGRPTPGDLLGTAAYGERFACAAERDNVFGVQFHPEKSSAAGLRLLSNFAGICAASQSPRRDPLPGDRHPRRPGGAPAAGRLRARDDLRRRPGRRGEALGRAKAPRSCTSSTSTARRAGAPQQPRRGAPDRRRRSSARSRSAAACATPTSVAARARRRRRAGGDRHRGAARPRVLVEALVAEHGERVVVSVDARGGRSRSRAGAAHRGRAAPSCRRARRPRGRALHLHAGRRRRDDGGPRARRAARRRRRQPMPS